MSILKSKLVEAITGLANTGLSLIRDKNKAPEVSFIDEKVKKGVSISSRRVLNLTGTTAIISVALLHIDTHGINQLNLALLGLGIVFSLGMTWLTVKDGVNNDANTGGSNEERQ